MNPQSIGAVNCAPPSAPNHSGHTTSSNDFPSDIGDVNVVSANPETPVVSDLNLDALDSVFEPFFDSTAHGKEAPDSSSLGLDSLSSIAKSDVETNVSQVFGVMGLIVCCDIEVQFSAQQNYSFLKRLKSPLLSLNFHQSPPYLVAY